MSNGRIFCPYAVNRQEIVNQRSSVDEDGKTVLAQQIVNKASFVECQRENCGVFYDGRCHYNGVGR